MTGADAGSVYDMVTVSSSVDGKSFTGITFDGNRQGNPAWPIIGNATYGLAVFGSNITVQDCEFKNVLDNGCGSPVYGENIIFDKVFSHDNGKKGIYCGNVNKLKIINGYYYNNGDETANTGNGIGVHQGLNDSIIINNHCYGNHLYGIYLGDTNEAPDGERRTIITNNWIYNNGSVGMNIQGESDTKPLLYATVTNNHIFGNSYGVCVQRARLIDFSHNQIYKNEGYGFYTTGDDLIDSMVSHNIIANNCTGDDSLYAMRLYNADSLTGNTIEDNKFVDSQDTPTQKNGIFVGLPFG